ncbi:MAG: phosphoenolpyruvate carboxylase [Chitinophagaceae bacterium]|nr:phosphoenolpyruvate carboxylase [Chitinophagaceae bacterium]
MDYSSNRGLQHFRSEVGLKYQLYNSLFTSLPFHRIEKTGILLSLLSNNCEEGYKKNQSPAEIMEDFFNRHTIYTKEQDRNDLLFRFVQYVERQVVLFDALEDAAFGQVNDMNGPGTMKQLESDVMQSEKEKELTEKLKDFSIRLVLTAHPTQFYPGSVLGIINDLSRALAANQTNLVNTYLQQLGKTPFFNKKKPTPYDEAVSLVWYLENVFYPAAGRIITNLKSHFPDAVNDENPLIRMGFWPGGDRDGNPFVTHEITLQVADALRGAIIKCYYMDVRKLKRRLTFEGVDSLVSGLETKLYDNLFIPGHKTSLDKKEIIATLTEIRDILIYKHNRLFLHLVDNLIHKIQLFGLYFSTLDIRQDSSIHDQVVNILAEAAVLPAGFSIMDDQAKLDALTSLQPIAATQETDPMVHEALETIRAIKQIQHYNGAEGCNRYIISQCKSALHVMEVYGLFLLAGWKEEELNIDIIPLFETIDDLQHAAGIMETLYQFPAYKKHLAKRMKRQTIMLGFSDGTKDGGYLMANWSIYKAKEELTRLSAKYDVDVIFFDGRGGPPSRGGGKTHKFYASMGHNISNKEIQLTIQGQTVSSNFGTTDAAQFNIEQLLNAGISNGLFSSRLNTLTKKEEKLLEELADAGYNAYRKFRDHPYLADYLLQVSPLRFYSETNIGSRPAKRGSSSGISLKDLRAIPYAGSWAQLKQNVTGYFGVGTALKEMEEKGRIGEIQELYRESLFFRTLLDNCEMAMMKSFFPLTAYLSKHPIYGGIWLAIREEYELTRQYLGRVTGNRELMAAYPIEQVSIQMRERIVLPLLTIQQYALGRIRDLDPTSPLKETFEKLAMRCSFGIINAGRNSA